MQSNGQFWAFSPGSHTMFGNPPEHVPPPPPMMQAVHVF
jgi:hypothetical protein